MARSIKFRSVALNFECAERFTRSRPRVGQLRVGESKNGRYIRRLVSSVTCGRANYVIKWLIERFAFSSVPRVHTLRFPSTPPTNSSSSQSRYIFQSVQSSGAFANPVIDPRHFIPTDNCISVHCYQREPWTLVYEDIFTIHR